MTSNASDDGDDDNMPFIAGLIAAGAVALIAIVFLVVMTLRERSGKPVFMKLEDIDSGSNGFGDFQG